MNMMTLYRSNEFLTCGSKAIKVNCKYVARTRAAVNRRGKYILCHIDDKQQCAQTQQLLGTRTYHIMHMHYVALFRLDRTVFRVNSVFYANFQLL